MGDKALSYRINWCNLLGAICKNPPNCKMHVTFQLLILLLANSLLKNIPKRSCKRVLKVALFLFFFKLYIIVLVLPNIKMNPPQVSQTKANKNHQVFIIRELNDILCQLGQHYINGIVCSHWERKKYPKYCRGRWLVC